MRSLAAWPAFGLDRVATALAVPAKRLDIGMSDARDLTPSGGSEVM